MDTQEFFIRGNDQYRDLVLREAQRAGLPPQFLAGILNTEVWTKNPDISWNKDAGNAQGGSAVGLGQFIDPTWLALAQQPGNPVYDYAMANNMLDGQGMIRPESQAMLLKARTQAPLSVSATAHLAAHNRDVMAGVLKANGIDFDMLSQADQAELLYLAHMTGKTGKALRLKFPNLYKQNGFTEAQYRDLLMGQTPKHAQEYYAQNENSWAKAYEYWMGDIIRDRFAPGQFFRAPTPGGGQDYS